MHWPKVFARTATPKLTCATWVTPGIRRTLPLLRTRTGVPLSVGARQTMVGRAPLTFRSVVKSFRPVTAARASTRLVGVPTTVKSASPLSCTSTARSTVPAARVASSPYVTEEPSGAVITPPLATRPATVSPRTIAAASSRAARATAAATRIGVYVEMVVLEPPVSWLNTSSGRAGARVTSTLSSGRSSSSAMSIAVEVVMPWPTSIRGSAKVAVPSSRISTVMRLAVGRAASVSMSLRSYSSGTCGGVGTAAAARGVATPRSAAATRVEPART